MMERELVEQGYWDQSYKNFNFFIAPGDDDVRVWIEHHINRGTGCCFEVGCFPGRYLSVFGELGYTLNGLDLAPGVETDLPAWLKKMGYNVGNFFRYNFDDFALTEKYDLVCSFGFIEHFTDWEDCFVKHLQLVASGGYVVVTTPNFAGPIQGVLHRALDRVNYDHHNILSMNPHKWAELAMRYDFEIVFSGFFGNFDFWVDPQARVRLQTIIINWIINHKLLLRKMPDHIRLYAPYCGIIAKKR